MWYGGILKCGKTGQTRKSGVSQQVALKNDPFVANNSPHAILDSQLSREAHKVHKEALQGRWFRLTRGTSLSVVNNRRRHKGSRN